MWPNLIFSATINSNVTHNRSIISYTPYVCYLSTNTNIHQFKTMLDNNKWCEIAVYYVINCFFLFLSLLLLSLSSSNFFLWSTVSLSQQICANVVASFLNWTVRQHGSALKAHALTFTVCFTCAHCYFCHFCRPLCCCCCCCWFCRCFNYLLIHLAPTKEQQHQTSLYTSFTDST